MDGFVGHGGRVGAALARHDRRVRPLAPLLELLDGRGPERVPGGEHRRSRQKARELAYGRGLARPVHPDHQDDRGLVRDVELDGTLEHARGVLYHELPQLGTAGDVLLQRLLLELADELRRGRYPHVGGDQDLLDPLPEFLVLDVPELGYSGVQLPDERVAAAAETLPEPAKPST